MTDPMLYLTMAAAGLAAFAMMTVAMLSGWRGWLALKSRELALAEQGPGMPASNAAARIEMADLKERLKKLEAIAAGVEL